MLLANRLVTKIGKCMHLCNFNVDGTMSRGAQTSADTAAAHVVLHSPRELMVLVVAAAA